MRPRNRFPSFALFVLVGLAGSRLEAAGTSFDALAFVPEAATGPQVTLPDHPTLNWTRVAFRPQRTNQFPEELKPVRVFTSPVGSSAGLAVAGDDLWAASRATNRIYRIEVKSGAVRDSLTAPAERPAGLCWDGQVLWQTDRQGRCVFGLDATGKVMKRFAVTFEPSAVLRTADGLLVSDWAKDEFHRLDPETGRDLGTERAPDDRLTGLASVGRYLWCSRGSEIICFARQRGLPVCGFSAAYAGSGPLAVSGLTADQETLWYANSAGNEIVQVRIPRHGEWVGGSGRVRQIGFEMVYWNTSTQAVESLSVLQHVPFLEMPGQRYLALRVQPTPRAYFRDDLGNVIALVDFGRLPPKESARCQIAATMWVADRRMVVDLDRLGASTLLPEQRAYARSFHRIPGEDSAEVKAFVEQAVGGETNAYWRIRKAHDALCRAIVYREPADESVPGVLRQGYGVCRNYSAAMESFGRLLGVPVLNAWAPRHETCFLMLPGVSPAVMEVTANDSGPDPATTWRRSRWFLGTSAGEITTGVRGFAMHSPLLLDGTPYTYQWHYWTPTALQGIRHEGWWTVTDPNTGKTKRL